MKHTRVERETIFVPKSKHAKVLLLLMYPTILLISMWAMGGRFYHDDWDEFWVRFFALCASATFGICIFRYFVYILPYERNQANEESTDQ